jgi:DNA-3-methyladenine glycosylase II
MKGFRNGLKYLSDTCPHMHGAMQSYGHPKSRKLDPGFATLVRIIISQQVSVPAGAAIWGRLEVLLGDVSPESVLCIGQDGLCSAGLSGAKARYVKGIAHAIVQGDIDLKRLSRCREDTVRRQLMALKGIGLWTADIYLMFAIGRPDILPIGDMALRAAAGNLLRLKERPSPAELGEIAKRWTPHRTVASAMLWHYYMKIPSE